MGKRRLQDKDDKDTEDNMPRSAANARERTRMRVLSKSFERLKLMLPWVPADTKLSKLDTLRLVLSISVYCDPLSNICTCEILQYLVTLYCNVQAMTYINHLHGLLTEPGDPDTPEPAVSCPAHKRAWPYTAHPGHAPAPGSRRLSKHEDNNNTAATPATGDTFLLHHKHADTEVYIST